MENFNRVLSFVLGLIVVIVFVIVLSGRLNLRDKFLPFQNTAKAKITPTITPLPTTTLTPTPTTKQERGFFSRLFQRATPTPTQKPKTVESTVVYNNYQTGQPVVKEKPKGETKGKVAPSPTPVTTKGGQPLTQIPSTGPETSVLAFLIAPLFVGLYLLRKK